jgi:hypothetical protein
MAAGVCIIAGLRSSVRDEVLPVVPVTSVACHALWCHVYVATGCAGGGLVEGQAGLPPVGRTLPTRGWHCRAEHTGGTGACMQVALVGWTAQVVRGHGQHKLPSACLCVLMREASQSNFWDCRGGQDCACTTEEAGQGSKRELPCATAQPSVSNNG